MRKINLALLLAVLFGFFVSSCAHTGEPGEHENYPGRIEITRYSDLNGDGVMDTITLIVKDEMRDEHILQVNDVQIEALGCAIDPLFNLVDIDLADQYQEIAVSEYGPSGDFATTFYYYDGRVLYCMGKVDGFYGPSCCGDPGWRRIAIDGSGYIATVSKGSILHTWFYRDEFELSTAHLLVRVQKDLYEMNTPVEVIAEIPLQRSRSDPTIIYTLQKGDKATIVASDNKEWCAVRNEKGETGWFAVVDYDVIKGLGIPAGAVFNGLNYAD